jgi:hypothetical protein
MGKRSQSLSDSAKAVAVVNAGLSASFAAAGQPVFAIITGAAAAGGLAVDLVNKRVLDRDDKKK